MSPLVNIDFAKGLQEQYEDSMIPLGAASALNNLQPDPTGGLRVRTGWSKSPKTGMLENVVKGRGVGSYQTASLENLPEVVQVVTGPDWDDSSSSYTISWSSAPVQGNTIICAVEITQEGASTNPSVNTPSTLSESWSTTSAAQTQTAYARIFYKNNIGATEPLSLTLTFNKGTSGKAFGRAYLIEVSGLAVHENANPVMDEDAVGTTASSLGLNQATVSSNLGGGVAYALNTALSANNTVQGVEFGICIAAAHNSNVTTSTVGSLSLYGYNYPDFYPLGGWESQAELAYGKIFSGNSNRSGNSSILMTQNYLTIGKVRGEVAFVNADATPDASTGVAIAMASFRANVSSVTRVDRRYVVANDNGNGHTIYATIGDNIGAASYSALGLVPSTGSEDQVAFATGLGVTMMTCARWTVSGEEGPRVWSGTGGLVRLGSLPSGRAIAFHKSRFFIAGTKAHPTRLWFSDVGDYDLFGNDSFIEVSQEDGEPIEDIAVFENALLIGKQSSLWVLTGSGIDSFVLTRLNSGGAAPGRTICATPYGAVVAAREAVYLISSESVVNISDPIRESYAMTGTHMSVTYADGTVYVTDVGSGKTWAMDMKTGAWWNETMSSAGDAPAAYLYSNATIFAAPSNSSNTGPLISRRAPGGTRTHDYSPLTGNFEVKTPEMWLAGPSAKFTPRHLFLTIRQRAGNPTQSPMAVTAYYDGVEQDPVYIRPVPDAGSFRARIDLGAGKSISSVQFAFTHTVPDAEDVLFDIEKVMLDAYIEKVR